MIEVSPDELKHAVESQHGGTATLVQSVPIDERHDAKPVWQGVVHVFDLAGHPKAKRAYAWSSPNLIHRAFDPARLNIEIKDRFGNPVGPREWFLVPVFIVNEAVERIKDGTITQYAYDPKTARLVQTGRPSSEGAG